jgi:hypothetical protein
MARDPAALDPLGIVALASILTRVSDDECSCEHKCVCDNKCSCESKCSCEHKCVCDEKCSCENKCVCDDKCSCENKCVCDEKCACDDKCSCDEKGYRGLYDMVSNPVFREVVRGLDPQEVRTIEDFLEIVDNLRTKINAPPPSAPSSEPAAPKAKARNATRKRGGAQ